MGTMLQKSGLELGRQPDVLGIEQPEIVERIGRMYVESGSGLDLCQHFWCEQKKLSGCGYTVEQVIAASVGCAKSACRGK